MAVRFNIGPGHDGLNLDLSEETILIHAVESIRSRIPGTERWLSEFDELFYNSDRGLSLRFLEHINRHLRRLGRPALAFEETGWTDYMHVRNVDKIKPRQSRRDAVGTPLGETHLAWAEAAVTQLPPARPQRTFVPESRPAPMVSPEPTAMRDRRPLQILDDVPDEALFLPPDEAPAEPPPAPPAPASAEQIAEVLDSMRRIEQSLADLTRTVADMARAMERAPDAPRRASAAEAPPAPHHRAPERPGILNRVLRRIRH